MNCQKKWRPLSMKKTKIYVRLDDICPTMNWSKFYKVIEICEKFNIYPLLGIVPNNKDKKLMVDKENPNFWQEMKILEEKGCAIAQHGVDHVYKNKDGGILKLNKQSDIVGEPYETQLELLKNGKELLEEKGFEPKIYMAPSHSYDKNTIKALKELNFEFVTDGYTNYIYTWQGLTFIPCKNTYKLKPNSKGVITLCLHINTMKEKDLEMFEATLNQNKENLFSFKDIMTEQLKPKKLFRINQKFNLLTSKLKVKTYKLLYGRRK